VKEKDTKKKKKKKKLVVKEKDTKKKKQTLNKRQNFGSLLSDKLNLQTIFLWSSYSVYVVTKCFHGCKQNFTAL